MLRLGSQIGHYRLLKLLGHGGMGFVYEAEHVDLGKHVAIKTLHPQVAQGADGRARFLLEGRAAAMVRHPNICEVFDFGQEEDTLYLVMELLEGQNLDRFLDQEGLLGAGQTADLMVPVLAAVGSMHRKGILHRDLKPANIFLAQGPYGNTEAKVLDFGIAKLTEGAPVAQTAAAMLGTAHYVSPEQARSKPLDARSDQYSLGVILYEMLGGAKPFDAPNIPAIMQEIVNGTVKPLHHLVPDVPAALEAAVLKALNRDPAKRHESVFELGTALYAFAGERTRAIWGPVFDGAAQPAPVPPRRKSREVEPEQQKAAQEETTGPLPMYAKETVPETTEDAMRRSGGGCLIPTSDKDAAEQVRKAIREAGKIVVLCQVQGPQADSKPPLSGVLQAVTGLAQAVVLVSDPEKPVWHDPLEDVGQELAPGQPWAGAYLFFEKGRFVASVKKDLFNPASDGKKVRDWLRDWQEAAKGARKPAKW